VPGVVSYTAGMASARNNKIQERRAALREQHKREREAADAAFKALDDEYAARVAAARAVASVVELVGKERAAILLDLEPRDVAAYLKFVEEVGSTGDAVGDRADGNDKRSDDKAAASSGESSERVDSAASAIPEQGAAAAAAASV